MKRHSRYCGTGTSEFLGESVNINPTESRKIMEVLENTGLV
ncbi:Rrf2 family transcriptional regulator [Lysinibacillus telephonicus]|nr:Rrf2 family transcriptional regulator [Lysinibacillus telephonicus]